MLKMIKSSSYTTAKIRKNEGKSRAAGSEGRRVQSCLGRVIFFLDGQEVQCDDFIIVFMFTAKKAGTKFFFEHFQNLLPDMFFQFLFHFWIWAEWGHSNHHNQIYIV